MRTTFVVAAAALLLLPVRGYAGPDDQKTAANAPKPAATPAAAPEQPKIRRRKSHKQNRPVSSRPGGDIGIAADSERQAALTSASSAASRRPLALLESTSVMRCTAPRSSSLSTAAIWSLICL